MLYGFGKASTDTVSSSVHPVAWASRAYNVMARWLSLSLAGGPDEASVCSQFAMSFVGTSPQFIHSLPVYSYIYWGLCIRVCLPLAYGYRC